MNYYKCSDGSRISKAQIDRNVRKAKSEIIQRQLNEHGFNFCEKGAYEGCPVDPDNECNILDCSHIESVDSCQKNGRAEKAWDINNMTILGRKCHKIRDGVNLKFKSHDVL